VKKYLAVVVQAGIITPALFRTATSSWRQMAARFSALFKGKYRKTVRFYQVCGEYAHKCRQAADLGDEGGNTAILQQLRLQMAQLAPSVQS
jgi:3-deoxy-D-manno-octulosonate 8-phosphate phosphatase KdsC-like HAD superfamily phosphatase